MISKYFARFVHVSRIVNATDKSALGTLRKKTGYTFSNCKKALELHQNDIIKAEKWLKDQAQAMGWEKAVKLEGRATKQGLIGVLVENNIGALVEVNCETDFVARNKNFQEFVEMTLKTCVKQMENMPTNDILSKMEFRSDSLKELVTADNKNLGDKLALLIGNVGENASLRRALCFKATNSILLTGLAHPTVAITSSNAPQLGRYGAIVAMKPSNKSNAEINKNICQHIVGMNPKKIGVKDLDQPNDIKDDEQCLIYQEYLLEPSMSVDELLNENDITIIDFQRFECGENLDDLNTLGNVNVEAVASN